jgi:hypothetical protein
MSDKKCSHGRTVRQSVRPSVRVNRISDRPLDGPTVEQGIRYLATGMKLFFITNVYKTLFTNLLCLLQFVNYMTSYY